jgi:hypothetical protein
VRRDHGQRPPLLPKLRSQTLSLPLRFAGPVAALLQGWRSLWGRSLLRLVCVVSALSLAAPGAMAAEIFSVRGPTQLRVGDQNRSTAVDLACIEVRDERRDEALSWLRQHATRGTKVNLRPVGQREGILVAHVTLLNSGLDLGEALLAEGMATPTACDDTPQT